MSPAPVFWSEKIEAAIAGGSPDDQLTILAGMIEEAAAQKDRGFGPPADELVRARRRWLAIYDSVYSERISA